jgi:RNA polymerase sigma-70 factor (ECF subfamily)
VNLEQQRHIKAEDAALVERWRRGDISAIERLAGKYQGRIYNLILKICANPDTAAELTQDTFVKIIENIDRFESRSSFYTWAFRIAVNLTLNYCKRRTTVRWTSLEAEKTADDEQTRQTLAAILLDDKSPDPAQIAENRELCRIVQASLDKLDEEQKTVIVLRDIEGMDYAQIAEVLALELGTVKSRLSRARAALRKTLTDTDFKRH